MKKPPKKTARGRGQDRLILYVWMEGGANISPDKITELLEELHTSFYMKKGTVTSALKSLIEDANNVILQYNRKYVKSGVQAIGHLSAIVSKGESFYLAQSGKGHGFYLINDEIDYMHDPQSAGPGLGINRSPSMKFFQKQLSSEVKILLVNTIPTGWNADSLSNTSAQSLTIIRRRLLGEANVDYQGILIDPVPGNGDLNLIRSTVELNTINNESRHSEKNDSSNISGNEPTQKIQKENNFSYEKTNSQKDETEEYIAVPSADVSERTESEYKEPTKPEIKEIPKTKNIKKINLNNISDFFGNLIFSLRKFSNRIIPNDFTIKLPSSWMAIIAIAIPLILSAIAASVFFNQGAKQQYQLYYNQAEVAHQQAVGLSDPIALISAWTIVLDNVENAQRYQETEEAELLKNEARAAIDFLEKITRINYEPIILGSLADSVNITRIVESGKDLYMLDSNSGEVIRALYTGAKYEIDADFICEPHAYGTIIVSKLIDIVPLPKSSANDPAVLAMDEKGNLMYCIPELPPLVVSLPIPDTLWRNPKAITLEDDALYVLDPDSNAVWFYNGQDFQFQSTPNFFFIDKVPNLSGAIDLAVNEDDLFVLYEDGHTVVCSYSILEEAPTECVDPAVYIDDRGGKESGEFLSGATFYQIFHSQPTEPSIYYLDPIEGTIYHFTVKLNLVNQYRPSSDLVGDYFSAISIIDNKKVYMVKGNEVYLGYIP